MRPPGNSLRPKETLPPCYISVACSLTTIRRAHCPQRGRPFWHVSRLWVAPDCGLKYLSDIVYGKMCAWVKASGL
jgi:hypothetical protein